MLSAEGTNEIHQRKVMSPKNINQRTLKTFCSSFLSEGVKKETSLPLPPLIFRCSDSHRDIFSVQRFVEARILLDQNFTQGNGRFCILEEIWTCLSSASTRCTEKSSITEKYLSRFYQPQSTSELEDFERALVLIKRTPRTCFRCSTGVLASRLAALLLKASQLIHSQSQT